MISVDLKSIGYGQEAMIATVDIMIDTIRRASKDYYVRSWAERLSKGNYESDNSNGNGDECSRLMTLFFTLASKIRYIRDPLGVEMLKNPRVILAQIEQENIPMVDCDCMTTLLLALARSLGYPTAIRVISVKPQGKWNHVYGMALCQVGRDKYNKLWVPLDMTRPDKGFGWEYPKAAKVYTRIVR